jgi:tetratricopeptide (TPR) repeat protein
MKTVRDLFHALASARPLVLVFEDLHWADASSAALLEALLRLVEELPVLFVFALRPERDPSVQRLLDLARAQFRRRTTELTLAPLDGKQCDQLIRNLLKIDDLPFAVRHLVAGKAEGNPFFIEEVLRALIDEGAIEHHEGAFRVTERIDQVVIPGTIQEVVLTRVERLPPAAQTLLRMAAVIGRSFPYRVLEAVAGTEAQGLDWKLRHLERRQLIAQQEVRGERELFFTHALAQAAIYESISQRARRELHAQTAAAIETLYAERLADFYGMLAYHYSRAERLAEAEDYLFRAGDEAARAAASSEALAFFQEASRLYFRIHGAGGDPRRKALLEKNVALALLRRGQLLESLDHFNMALAHLDQPVPARPLVVNARFAADLAVLLARVYASRGKPPIGRLHPDDRESLEIRYNRHRAQSTSDPKRLFIDTIASVRLLARSDPRAVEQASGMYAAVGAAFAFAGISFGVSRRILAIAEALIRAGSVRDLFVYRAFKFLVDHTEGRWEDEAAIAPELLAEGLRHGLAWDANTYLGLHAEQAIVRGDFARAEADVATLAEMADEYGFEFARSNQYFMTAYLLLQQRRLGPALEAIERYAADRHEDALNVLALGTRAQMQLLADAEADAAASLAEVERLLPRAGAIPPYHLAAYTGSRFLLDVMRLEAAQAGGGRASADLVRLARRSARRAVRLAARIAREQPLTYRLVGRLHWLLGKPRAARRWWGRALGVDQRLGARPELARLHFEIGRRLGEPTSPLHTFAGLDAAGNVERARTLFAALGLEWDLGRVTAPRRAA